MNIAIGGDHAGFEYKQQLIDFLTQTGHTVRDFGPESTDSVDYPDHVHPLTKAISSGDFTFGILICGSGNGVAMTANKRKNIRAGLCWNTEVAQVIREHNNANVICLPARFVSYQQAEDMVKVFLKTEFEGGRHQRRVDKMFC